MARRLASASIAALLGAAGLAQAQFSEPFDSAVVPPAGWFTQNNSAPIGVIGYFDGNPSVFTAQAGTSYLGVNYNSGAGLATISNWMVSPVTSLTNGQQLTFWTRTAAQVFPDRLQVRMNKANTGTNVGAVGNATAVGDFTDLLLDINPTYVATGYPVVWTQFTVTVTGVTGTVNGRLAFRYFVENAGPSGSNSDYIGIDEAVLSATALPTGHCCKDGNCTEITQTACINLGGTNWVSGSHCNDVGFSCPQPASGACCKLDGTCATMTAAACTTLNGVYKGDGSACSCPSFYAYGGSPVAVPDGGVPQNGSSGADAVVIINVPNHGTITDVDTSFQVSHTWQGDVRIKLVAPGGQTAVILNRPGVVPPKQSEAPNPPIVGFGFSTDNFGTVGGLPQTRFVADDAATTGIYDDAVGLPGAPGPGTATATADVKGRRKPLDAFSVFNGTDQFGDWKLIVNDYGGGDFGTINAAALYITVVGAPSCYADCDHVGGLTGNDFQCFLNAYVANLSYADCDGVGGLTGNDFQCFLDKYVAGCS